VQRVVGLDNPIDMTTLTYTTTRLPDSVASERFQCADAGAAAGAAKEVRVCVYNGGHTYPFLHKEADVLHGYIWDNFFHGGTRV